MQMKHRGSPGKQRELLAPDLVCILGDKKVSEQVSSVRRKPLPSLCLWLLLSFLHQPQDIQGDNHEGTSVSNSN